VKDLARFHRAQDGAVDAAMDELKRGRKTSHWMWFVFPQFAGLGRSATAQKYAIRSPEEARDYLDDPVLGSRLRECCEQLLAHRDRSANAILGSIDAVKLRSSMTLFLEVSGDPLFRQVLDAFYGGERDPLTLALLKGESP
jgi:uncharacterized protein (DUF1810 family)